MDVALQARVGDVVTYTDSKGHTKPAMVLVTPESYVPADGGEVELPPLEAGEVHLRVFALRGGYTRLSVPRADEPLAGSPSWRER